MTYDVHAELRRFGSCDEARAWAAGKTEAEIWPTCERGDWLLWWAGRCSGPPDSKSRKLVVRAACACARLALPIFEAWYPSDLRPRKAIETAEAYTRGEATLKDIRAAANDAYAAYNAAATAAADDDYYCAASYAAAAATAAADDASAAVVAYSAVDYAAYAYAYADAYAAKASMRRQCADLVRSIIPTMPRPS